MADAPSLTPDEIARDARWLVQACDPRAGLVRLVSMTAEDYRAASFLDDRMLQQPRDARLQPLPLLIEASRLVDRADARWIFHIGHVGSTLVARLLGELDGVLSIREPRALRDLALLGSDVSAPLAEPMRRLFSRAFPDRQASLVKATSFVSEMAADLVGDGRALFLTVSPRSYIQTILAGENSRKELRAMLPFRLERMKDRLPGVSAAGSDHDATLAALAWACEMTSLEAAAERLGSHQSMWADFDALLGDMGSGVQGIGAFFRFEASDEQIGTIVTGPLMRRYSKALEYDYSPQLRRDLLEEASAMHRAEIAAALHWLGAAASGSPLLRRALDRATT